MINAVTTWHFSRQNLKVGKKEIPSDSRFAKGMFLFQSCYMVVCIGAET
jgi:hypothetical protein